MNFRSRVLNFLLPHVEKIAWTRLPLVKELERANDFRVHMMDKNKIDIPDEANLKFLEIYCYLLMTAEELDELRATVNRRFGNEEMRGLRERRRSHSESFQGGDWGVIRKFMNKSSGYHGFGSYRMFMHPDVEFAELEFCSILPALYAVTLKVFLKESVDASFKEWRQRPLPSEINFFKSPAGYGLVGPNSAKLQLAQVGEFFQVLLGSITESIFSPEQLSRLQTIPCYGLDEPQGIFQRDEQGKPKASTRWEEIGFVSNFDAWSTEEYLVQLEDRGHAPYMFIANYALISRSEKYDWFGHKGRFKVSLALREQMRSFTIFVLISQTLSEMARQVALDRSALLRFRKQNTQLRRVGKIYGKLMRDWAVLDRLCFEIENDTWHLKRVLDGLDESKPCFFRGERPPEDKFSNLAIEGMKRQAERLSIETDELRRTLQEYANVKNIMYGYRMQWFAIIMALFALSITIVQWLIALKKI